MGSPAALDSATGLITNRIGDKQLGQGGKLIDLGTANTFVSGLTGKLEIPQGQSLIIDGQKMTGSMQWTVRWDFDMDKLTHVNAEFGKGANNPTFAYTFSTGSQTNGKNNYADGYMRNAVRSMTQLARLDIQASHDTGRPQFLQGTDMKQATQDIVKTWQNLMASPCPALGAPRDSSLDPNGG